jgi:hypothetical protein
MNRFLKIGFLALVLAPVFAAQPLFAAGFDKDLSIKANDVQVPDQLLKGQSAKIYATVHNSSTHDLDGVVKIYDELTQKFVGSDQPVSMVAGKTDDVFVDFSSDVVGFHPIAIRVIPWDTKGDDPDNNKVTKVITVFADTDGDGVPDNVDNCPLKSNPDQADMNHNRIGDACDPDIDGDGVPNDKDAFPTDPKEWKDSDHDGVGDNSDAFPYDPKEWKDSDHDGKGDNSDPQPFNHSPIPDLQVSKTEALTGQAITFNALKSTDPDDPIAKYEWDFADGTKTTGVLVDHAFSQPGKYLVTLKVTDARGESDQKQAQVSVKRNWALPLLLGATSLLALLILGMLIPGSRFYYKKMIGKPKASKKNSKR